MQLNILQMNDNSGIQTTIVSSPKNGGKKLSQEVNRFWIEQNSFLEQQLYYHLKEHKTQSKNQFNLPDPTIIQVKEEDYLVLTTLDANLCPSISLFKIMNIDFTG